MKMGSVNKKNNSDPIFTSAVKRLSTWLLFCLIVSLLLNKESFALDKKTSKTISHYIMGVMYDDLGDIDRAIQEYKQALRLDYKNTVIHLNLAVSYIKKNKIDKATEELNTAIELDPEAVEPHAILTLLYSLQNKPEESNREYELALKNASTLHPKNIDIYKSLGALYLEQRKLEAAENVYRLILDLSPNDAEAHFYLANIYEQRGERSRTEEELSKSLKLKPDYHEALNYLGYLYIEENKNLDSAQDMIKKALEMEPDNGAYIDTLGWLYFKQGKLDEAIKTLTRASAKLSDPVIYEHLGDAYFKLGDNDSAKINWEKSLKLDPKQEKVKERS